MRAPAFSTPSILVIVATMALFLPAATNAQGSQHNESDLDFLNRMQSRFDALEKRAEQLDRYVRQLEDSSMQMNDELYSRRDTRSNSSRSHMSTDPTRLRSEIRSVKKQVARDREAVDEAYRDRADTGDFDHGKYDSRLKRMEYKLDEIERELRRL